MRLKTVIIDDSSIQRMAATFLVGNHPQLEIVGAYEDPREGVRAAVELEADLVILDVLYKDFTAFDLLDLLDPDTGVILNSSWTTYANRARLYPLTEFLLKPLKRSTLDEAISNIIEQKSKREDTSGLVHWI